MRRLLLAGNWKMHLTEREARGLASAILSRASEFPEVEVAVFPPFVYLDCVRQVLQGSQVRWGAQNCYFEQAGAFTGEVSPAMLADLGCRYVILGHSERRHILGEGNADVNRKARACLARGLSPIICVGEKLEEREAGLTQKVIEDQFHGSFLGLTPDQLREVVVAYEPVWAIGTGKVATPQQAQEVHAGLRKLVQSVYNPQVAEGLRILYGGSVKPENARELLACPDIDGALVGGASLVAETFVNIILASPGGP